MPPPPLTLTIPPLSQSHTQTIILLHGRGSNPSRLAPLLDTPFPSSQPSSPSPLSPSSLPSQTSPHPLKNETLRTLFPQAKFTLPHAPRSRATIYKRSVIPQWFDSWHVDLDLDDESDIREAKNQDWLMVEGLQEITAYLHGLIREEIALVGGRNVYIGGISQGCAASLVALLLWDGERLGGCLGMCGRLPFEGAMEEAMAGGKDGWDPFEREDEEDVFGRRDEEDNDEDNIDAGVAAVNELRERLELDGRIKNRPVTLATPVFMGHGTDDLKVPFQLGEMAVDCLTKMGVDVTWHTYPGLGHWYSVDMAKDMAAFLKINNTQSTTN
ncbi:hypothetical protein OQA88_13642 [Cercophora sp. LCS_1]